MDIQWHDVSIPLGPHTAVWPGDPPFQLTPADRIAQGNHCNTSILTFSTHTGTHCDAPWHFIDHGKRLDQIDPALFFGEALLLDLSDAAVIHAGDLGRHPLPPRLLLKTRNSVYPDDAPFQPDFVALEPDAAQRLVDEHVRLAGVDYLSVAPYKRSGPTHRILLENDVLVVEGLRLAGFGQGTYPFIVLPLPILGADGAPCRAFLGKFIDKG